MSNQKTHFVLIEVPFVEEMLVQAKVFNDNCRVGVCDYLILEVEEGDLPRDDRATSKLDKRIVLKEEKPLQFATLEEARIAAQELFRESARNAKAEWEEKFAAPTDSFRRASMPLLRKIFGLSPTHEEILRQTGINYLVPLINDPHYCDIIRVNDSRREEELDHWCILLNKDPDSPPDYEGPVSAIA